MIHTHTPIPIYMVSHANSGQLWKSTFTSGAFSWDLFSKCQLGGGGGGVRVCVGGCGCSSKYQLVQWRQHNGRHAEERRCSSDAQIRKPLCWIIPPALQREAEQPGGTQRGTSAFVQQNLLNPEHPVYLSSLSSSGIKASKNERRVKQTLLDTSFS